MAVKNSGARLGRDGIGSLQIKVWLHENQRDGSSLKFFAPFPTTIKVNILDQSLEIVGDRFLGVGTPAAAQEPGPMYFEGSGVSVETD